MNNRLIDIDLLAVWAKRDVGFASVHVNNCCCTRHTPLMARGYVREWDGSGKEPDSVCPAGLRSFRPEQFIKYYFWHIEI